MIPLILVTIRTRAAPSPATVNTEHRTLALLQNVTWVRALARELLNDRDVAEEVAQEALSIALERPPREDTVAGMRAWLRTVTRRLAYQVGLRESNRRSVEEQAARRVEVNTTDRVELQRTVAQVVLEVDEVYREVIVLRYFDGLAPREIARRLALPGTTVRKRLSRAHRQVELLLRSQLDADDDDLSALLGRLAAMPADQRPFRFPIPIAGAIVGGLALVVFLAVVLAPGRSSSEGRGHLSDASPGLSATVRGAIYVFGRPPVEPLEIRLRFDPQLTAAAGVLETLGDPVEWSDGLVVLRTMTGDRGYFEFGGLNAGQPVELLVPEDHVLNYFTDGELLDGGVGLEIPAGRELFWLGSIERDMDERVTPRR